MVEYLALQGQILFALLLLLGTTVLGCAVVLAVIGAMAAVGSALEARRASGHGRRRK